MKTVFFDLDGTLLPMDQDEFVNLYFGYLAKDMATLGYESKELIKNVWGGTAAMVRNDGSKTNEEAFWEFFASIYGEEKLKDKEVFNDFYRDDFYHGKGGTSTNPQVKEIIQFLKDHNYDLILATNPIFPSIATEQRIDWAGLDKNDFSYITTYENSCYCKPNPLYFQELLEKLHLKAEDCIMVGNDLEEDGAAKKVGMEVFIVTDCLMHEDKASLEDFPHGNFDDFLAWFKQKENFSC